jgi:hypothetical protein
MEGNGLIHVQAISSPEEKTQISSVCWVGRIPEQVTTLWGREKFVIIIIIIITYCN